MPRSNYPEGDVRQDIADLRFLIEGGQYLTDDEGHEYFQPSTMTIDRARAVEARLPDGPVKVIQIKTPTGWYQIEIGDRLTIRVLDAHKGIVVAPVGSNAIELQTRNL